MNILPIIASQLTITGSIMGTLEDMQNMMSLIAQSGIQPEIGAVLPMERANEAFRAMWEGRTHGKTVFTRQIQNEDMALMPLREGKKRETPGGRFLGVGR